MKPRLLAAIAALITVASAGNIGVPAISYGTYPGGGASGALQCVYRSTADAAHPTSWQMRKHGTTPWLKANPLGSPAIKVTTGSTFVDCDVHFTCSNGGDVPPPDQVVRVFCNQLAIVTVSYP